WLSLGRTMITHPFHPLNGRRLMVLFAQNKRTGLYFVCDVEGRRRATVRQEWTDRDAPASPDRLAVEGLTAARALVDAIDGSASGSGQARRMWRVGGCERERMWGWDSRQAVMAVW